MLAVLKPLWSRAPETASRLKGRIQTVLEAAQALGHIAEDKACPARWKGHLDKLLPKPAKLSRGHGPTEVADWHLPTWVEARPARWSPSDAYAALDVKSQPLRTCPGEHPQTGLGQVAVTQSTRARYGRAATPTSR